MKIWYNSKVKFTRETEDGFLKQVTESYLVDAVSYTEAESRIYEICEQNIRGEFSVTSISKTNIAEVINYEDEEAWYKAKITYSTVDADKGKEVKVTTHYLVSAAHVKQAFERIEDNLSSMLVPFEIPSISLTTIVEVYPFEAEAVSPEQGDTLDLSSIAANFEAAPPESYATSETDEQEDDNDQGEISGTENPEEEPANTERTITVEEDENVTDQEQPGADGDEYDMDNGETGADDEEERT